MELTLLLYLICFAGEIFNNFEFLNFSGWSASHRLFIPGRFISYYYLNLLNRFPFVTGVNLYLFVLINFTSRGMTGFSQLRLILCSWTMIYIAYCNLLFLVYSVVTKLRFLLPGL